MSHQGSSAWTHTNGKPEQVKKLLWLDESLWSKISEMAGYNNRPTATALDCTTSANPDDDCRNVVCSPDLPVYSTDPPPRPYQCELCNKTFSQRNTYQNHLRVHGIGPPSISNPVPSISPNAQPSSSNEAVSSSVPNSNNTSNPEDPYPCTICGKTFAVPARLTRHFRTHTGEKPYTCEYCHKAFSVKENLSVHRRIHTKERPYKCDVCARAFEHSGKLHRHMRIHTGERPHRCGVCGKTFIQSGQLVIHTRTHTGEKPYVCPVCNKGFTCSKQLKVHSRTHTGEKPYSCDICGKAFGYNHVLKLHQVAHYGEKVYKCTLCNTTFTNKKMMEAHIKTHSSGAQSGQSPSSSSASPSNSNSSPAQESSDKENNKEIIASSTRYVYGYQPPAVATSASTAGVPAINPALLAAVAVASSQQQDDEDSRSSSDTSPLRLQIDDGDSLAIVEPAVHLNPGMTSRADYIMPDREPSPEYSPQAPRAEYVDLRKRNVRQMSDSDESAETLPPSPTHEASASGAATKRSKLILQRYMMESTPTTPARKSSVICYAQKKSQD